MSSIVLPYGLGSEVRLELPPGVSVERCDAPRGQGMADASAAVAAALAEPLGHPPLIQATFPGDKIVVAVGEGVPQTATVVRTVVSTLIAGGASPADIAVLTTALHRHGFDGLPSHELADVSAARAPGGRTSPEEFPLSHGGAARWLPWEGAELPHLVHDPADRRAVALLARTTDQMPVLLNRALLDADVVVSIGCLRAEDVPGYDGPCGSLCPTFSDQATQRRFRALHTTEVPGQHAQRALAKAKEIAWLLGARFTVHVVPGRGEEVLHVLAGELDAVTEQGRALCERAWRLEADRPASLVIAAVEGGREQQTWENIGRALATAAPLAEPGGAIAICCDLETSPGAGLQQLAGADNPAEAVRALLHSHAPDALPAIQLARAVEELHVYLLSGLSRFTVEELGIVPVAAADELARLARSRPSCLLISGGQHVRVTLRKSGEQRAEC